MAKKQSWSLSDAVWTPKFGGLRFTLTSDSQQRISVISSKIYKYFDVDFVNKWIVEFTHNQCKNATQLGQYLQDDEKLQCTLYWNRAQIISLSWKQLTFYWKIFESVHWKSHLDVKKLIENDLDSIIPTDIDVKHVALMMEAIVTHDLTILKDKMSFDDFMGAASIMESMGIDETLWSSEDIKLYCNSSLKLPLKDVVKMSHIPGSIPSAICRDYLREISDELKTEISEMVQDCGKQIQQLNTHVTPSDQSLAQWIKHGLMSSVHHNQARFTFHLTTIQLLKYIDFCSTKGDLVNFFNAMDLIGNGSQLIELLRKDMVTMSRHVQQVWQAIWSKFGQTLLDPSYTKNGESDRLLSILIVILYYLAIHKKSYNNSICTDYDEWVSTLNKMRKDSMMSMVNWTYVMEQVLHAEKVHCRRVYGPYSKLSCIQEAVNYTFDTIKTQNVQLLSLQNLEFIGDYISWLRKSHSTEEEIVTDKLIQHIDSMTHVVTRYKVVLHMFVYYVDRERDSVPPMMRQVFQKYLPIQGWKFL